MGISAWHLGSNFNTPLSTRTPRVTIRCEYPNTQVLYRQIGAQQNRNLWDRA